MKELQKDFEMVFGGCDEREHKHARCALHAVVTEEDELMPLLEQPIEEE